MTKEKLEVLREKLKHTYATLRSIEHEVIAARTWLQSLEDDLFNLLEEDKEEV